MVRWEDDRKNDVRYRDPRTTGTEYHVDMNLEKDQAFRAFAKRKGMLPRDAARALLIWAAGILPKDFWVDSGRVGKNGEVVSGGGGGGFTNRERHELIVAIYPRGRKRSNVIPRRDWLNQSGIMSQRGIPHTLAEMDMGAALAKEEAVARRHSAKRYRELMSERDWAAKLGVDWIAYKRMPVDDRVQLKAEYNTSERLRRAKLRSAEKVRKERARLQREGLL